jgi:hypothetical protein
MDYNIRFMLVDILKNLGMKSIANDAISQKDANIISRYIKLIENKATKLNDTETLERLHFAGLIY